MPMEKQIPLGNKTMHSRTYNPAHLFPVERAPARQGINICHPLPFHGWDRWNAYEISWLDLKGKPRVAMGEFIFPCDTPNIVESKSLKLYLNSFNLSGFGSPDQVIALMQKDLSACAGGEVSIALHPSPAFGSAGIRTPCGQCIDHLEVDIRTYRKDASLLVPGEQTVSEILYSDLLRTNCPVTGQPDWGTVTIQYRGRQIIREGLLAYIVSFREHTDFHENCVEQIFADIMEKCRPRELSVYAAFTRRGGIDINPFRTTCRDSSENDHRLNQIIHARLARQ